MLSHIPLASTLLKQPQDIYDSSHDIYRLPAQPYSTGQHPAQAASIPMPQNIGVKYNTCSAIYNWLATCSSSFNSFVSIHRTSVHGLLNHIPLVSNLLKQPQRGLKNSYESVYILLSHIPLVSSLIKQPHCTCNKSLELCTMLAQPYTTGQHPAQAASRHL